MKTCLLRHLRRLNRSFRCELFLKIYCLISSSSIFCDLFQSGYSIDLLREKKRPTPRRQNLDGAELITPAVPSKTRPFYRTKRGIIIIIIGFFALLAVIVGAAVGSTKKKKSRTGDNNIISTSPPTSSLVHTISTVTSTGLSSRMFTWSPSGGGPITSVLPPGIGINEGRAPTATPAP